MASRTTDCAASAVYSVRFTANLARTLNNLDVVESTQLWPGKHAESTWELLSNDLSGYLEVGLYLFGKVK